MACQSDFTPLSPGALAAQSRNLASSRWIALGLFLSPGGQSAMRLAKSPVISSGLHPAGKRAPLVRAGVVCGWVCGWGVCWGVWGEERGEGEGEGLSVTVP